MKLILSFLLASVAAYGANITPTQYLQSRPKPAFNPAMRFPKLGLWSYSPWSTNLAIEQATNWGYVVDIGNANNVNYTTLLADPTSDIHTYISLSTNFPNTYKLQATIGISPPAPIPNGYYTTNSDGHFISGAGVDLGTDPGVAGKCISIEMDADYWTNTCYSAWLSPLTSLSNAGASVYLVYHPGEVIPTFFSASQGWYQDPRVTAAIAEAPWDGYTQGDGVNASSWLFWFDYSSSRYYDHYKPLMESVRSLFTSPVLLHYKACEGEQVRSLNLGTDWATGNHWNGEFTRSLSDIPDFECYYKEVINSGFTNNAPTSYSMLTRYLSAVGAYITYGGYTNLNYSWNCGGWVKAGTPVHADLDLWTGCLKCFYTGGMIGGIAGYFSSNPDTAFDEASPPHWLLQRERFSRVHALFSWLEDYLYSGDLLPGPNMHVTATDQPAYEFPNSASRADDHVLARKKSSSNDWLITAWAADGVDTNVTVTIPTLGDVTLRAAATGNVYRATVATGPRLVNNLGQPADISNVGTLRADKIRGR